MTGGLAASGYGVRMGHEESAASRRRPRIAVVGARPPTEAQPECDHAEWLRIVANVRRFVDACQSDAIFISGGATGVDEAAVGWRRPGQEFREHLPDYGTHGRSAPLVRNAAIVADADVVHAFPASWSRETWHTVRLAREAGKAVVVHHSNGDVTSYPRAAVRV